MGALRLLTLPAAMGPDIQTAREAWAGWRRAMEDERFVFEPEPFGLAEKWQAITETMPLGTRVDTDTYLAAFALAGDLTLATFDKGFARYPGLRVEVPE